jgi:hypothetical protein
MEMMGKIRRMYFRDKLSLHQIAKRTGQGYVYSRPILEAGAPDAFASMAFDPARFSVRYSQLSVGEGI